MNIFQLYGYQPSPYSTDSVSWVGPYALVMAGEAPPGVSNIYLGSDNTLTFYVGSTPVTSIYYGSTKVWE